MSTALSGRTRVNKNMKIFFPLCAIIFLAAIATTLTASGHDVQRDVKYDTKHERNVLDFYPPHKEAEAAPVFVFFHGGGFRQGDKGVLERRRKGTLDAHLEAGYAVVSCNYPFLGKEMDYQKIAHHCARSIQFIRSKSDEWKIDPKRIVCGGVSAGALISEFLAYHDDFADPTSKDSIEQQSSRPQVVVSIMQPIGTQEFALRFMDKGEAPLFIYSDASLNDRLHTHEQAMLIRDKAKSLGIPVVAYSGGRNTLPIKKNWLKAQMDFCKKHLTKPTP